MNNSSENNNPPKRKLIKRILASIIISETGGASIFVMNEPVSVEGEPEREPAKILSAQEFAHEANR